jgi:hypothetical protein
MKFLKNYFNSAVRINKDSKTPISPATNTFSRAIIQQNQTLNNNSSSKHIITYH